ncbi:MAG TPA: putative Se/S carrier-like protein [Clostridia bacterium]|nr:putative Se/S carrier-like protein [Clostridia bacterium]
MDTLASFRSRSEAIKLYNALRLQRIAAITINMPSKFRVGCGLSVLFPANYRTNVSILIRQLNLTTFIGFFVK